MPVYKIKTPDGRIMEIEGDYFPSHNVIEEAYAKLPPLEKNLKFEARKELYRRGELTGELKKVFDELNRRGLLIFEYNIDSQQTQQIKEETLVKNIKTFDDINPFYLYSPFYIPFLVLVVFSIYIIKKKIRSGWARIATFLSILWTLFCILGFFFQSPSSSNSYNTAMRTINDNLVTGGFILLIPIALLFFAFWSVKWIREGFKEAKNQLN